MVNHTCSTTSSYLFLNQTSPKETVSVQCTGDPKIVATRQRNPPPLVRMSRGRLLYMLWSLTLYFVLLKNYTHALLIRPSLLKFLVQCTGDLKTCLQPGLDWRTGAACQFFLHSRSVQCTVWVTEQLNNQDIGLFRVLGTFINVSNLSHLLIRAYWRRKPFQTNLVRATS